MHLSSISVMHQRVEVEGPTGLEVVRDGAALYHERDLDGCESQQRQDGHDPPGNHVPPQSVEEASIEEKEGDLDGPQGGPEEKSGDELEVGILRGLALEKVGRQRGAAGTDSSNGVEHIGKHRVEDGAGEDDSTGKTLKDVFKKHAPVLLDLDIQVDGRQSGG